MKATAREKTMKPERAKFLAKPIDAERARVIEKSIVVERAIADEEPIERERATVVEKTMVVERAIAGEKPKQVERTMSPDTPTKTERASRSDKPSRRERANGHEKPISCVRARSNEKPRITEREIDQARAEIRFTVDAYYTCQERRIAIAAQARALQSSSLPSEWIEQFLEDFEKLESGCAKRLKIWADALLLGRWAQTITGVSGIIAAGLIAHIDPRIAKSPSAVWRFAGLDPTAVWGKGEKRPHNAALKTLCWKIGESFVKVSGKSADFYGKVYLERKMQEISRNEDGKFGEQAKATLGTKRFKSKAAQSIYASGKLPDGHIHARAKRYAVKLFLSHFWAVAYEIEHGVPAPLPWIIAHGGHVDYVPPPNWPMADKAGRKAS